MNGKRSSEPYIIEWSISNRDNARADLRIRRVSTAPIDKSILSAAPLGPQDWSVGRPVVERRMIGDDDDDPDPAATPASQHNAAPTNGQPKSKCFNILPSLLRRKSTRLIASTVSLTFRKHSSFEALTDDKLTGGSPFPMTDSCLAPGSPISPRVKNFNSDMRSLALSRSDNPFISQQMERSNSTASDYSSDCTLSTPILSVRKNRPCYFSTKKADLGSSGPLFDLSTGNDTDCSNLHDKLIRSPPPNFPEKLSQFLFTESYIGQIVDD